MKLIKSNRQFNQLTLTPYDMKDRELFWEFRRDDATSLFKFGLFFVATAWFGYLYTCKEHPERFML